LVNFAFSRVENCHVFRAGGGTHLGFLKKSIKAYKGIEGFKKKFTRFLNPINHYMPHLEKRVFYSSKRIIAISKQVKGEIVEIYGSSLEEKVSVIPNSVDLERFNPDFRRKNREKERNKFGLKSSNFVVGFASSNFKLKGLEFIVKSLKNLPSNILLFVAGGRNPIRYKKLAEKLGIEKRVIFLGKVSQMEFFYSLIDCLVHPSFYDTFGNVVAEALAMNVPVIVSPYTGAKDFVVEGKNGFVLKGVNEKEIEICIRKVMRMNPDFSANRLLRDGEVFNLYLREAERCLL
jgi:UDP-glucose:(heptosyl)LPS alpha-1,3-glucosyltransferase